MKQKTKIRLRVLALFLCIVTVLNSLPTSYVFAEPDHEIVAEEVGGTEEINGEETDQSAINDEEFTKGLETGDSDKVSFGSVENPEGVDFLPIPVEDEGSGLSVFLDGEEGLLASPGNVIPFASTPPPGGTPATVNADVEINGIPEGGTINTADEIEVKVTMEIPVQGDGVDSYFVHGNTITLPLSDSFQFTGAVPSPPIPMEYDLGDGTKKLVGSAVLNNIDGKAVAEITFDGDTDIFDPTLVSGAPFSGVSAEFNARLFYNGNYEDDGDGDKYVKILEKRYELYLPEEDITYTLAKSGAENANGTITWTVALTAQDGTGNSVTPLNGYTFEDELSGVGKYVATTFNVVTGGTGTLVEPDSTAVPPTTKLTYTFADGVTTPQTITFVTEIPPTNLANGGPVTNNASLKDGEDPLAFNGATVTVSKPTGSKWGESSDPATGDYSPTDRTIDWYVNVNNQGKELQDLTINDPLKTGQTFKEAQWQRWNRTAGDYNETSAKVEANWSYVAGDPTWSSEPSGSNYEIGTVNYIGRLVLTVDIKDEDVNVDRKMHENDATVSWELGGQSGSFGVDAGDGVGVGITALSKTGQQIGADVDNHQVTWTISVDLRGQESDDFVVYDLIVHDSTTSDEDLRNATGWPATGMPSPINFNNIRRNNGQKYVETLSLSAGVIVDSYDLIPAGGGTPIATLLKISNLDENQENVVQFKTQVIDSNILTNNNPEQAVDNHASLYKGTDYRSQKTGSVKFNNKILSKELLHRDQVGIDHATGTDNVNSINANNRTTNLGKAFHYVHKEAIFCLNINGANLDFKDVESTLPGTEGFGTVTVVDTLPEGWEFVPFSNGKNYLIYNTTGGVSTGSGYPDTGSLQTTGNPLTSVTGLTPSFFTDSGTNQNKAQFTFDDLTQPYVILLKARPTGNTLDEYLKGSSDTQDKINTVGLTTQSGGVNKEKTQGIRVNSKLLEKNMDRSQVDAGQGYLTWTINYTPLDREIGSGIQDQIPQGIDLRTDSSGELIWEQVPGGQRNINVYELQRRSDGTYDQVQISLQDLMNSVTYDNDTRLLEFTFPTIGKDYRFTYVTDVTGIRGDIENSVKLLGEGVDGIVKMHPFSILASYGRATMSRSGYLVVQKQDMNGNPLFDESTGAEFTLYNTNADGTQGSARGTRKVEISDGNIAFYGLAPGNYILKETKLPGNAGEYKENNLTYYVTVAPDLTTTVNGSATITHDDPYVVTNYRIVDPVGGLTISKAVIGESSATNKQFIFTVTFTGEPSLGTSYRYIGDGVPDGTIQSGETITLEDGQSITIIGVSTGVEYRVSEDNYAPDGYTVNGITREGIIETAQIKEANFINTKVKEGDLLISKNVEGSIKESGKQFEFVVTFDTVVTPPIDGYPYIGNGVSDGKIKSGDTILLADGQSITISDLPDGTIYTIQEIGLTDGYDVRDEVITGTMILGTGVGNAANFINYAPGQLTIRKIVEGDTADTKKKFDFTVTFLDANGIELLDAEYPYTGRGEGLAGGSIKNGDIISLAHGEEISITGLTRGMRYRVIEKDYSSQGYYIQNRERSENIRAGEDHRAEFVNSGSGLLTIHKTVEGVTADKNKKFDFTVTLYNADGEELIGVEYPYTGQGKDLEKGIIKSGDTISLAHGENITISDLIRGTNYQVVEADYSKDRYYIQNREHLGDIQESIEYRAEFVNIKYNPGDLYISKTVEGNSGEKDRKFDFTVTLSDKENEYTLLGANGESLGKIKGEAVISLADKESITIPGLPDETTYTVTENDYSAEGYKTRVVDVDGRTLTGVIESDKAAVISFVNSKNVEKDTTNNNNSQSDAPAGSNTQNLYSPKTGDDMPIMGYVIAVVLSFSGIAYFVYQKRKRKKLETK